MPNMTRVHIKRYIQELLKRAGTLAAQKVYLNRPVNYSLDPEEAEVRIMSLNSTSKREDGVPRRYKRTYILGIEMAYSPNEEDYDVGEDAFEALVAQVEFAIESDELLENGEIRTALNIPEEFCVEDTFLDGMEYRTEADGERPIYVCLVNYNVCYNYETGPSAENLDDLESIHTETGPSDGSGATPSLDSTVRV